MLLPDQQGLVEGLWTGDLAWNDEQGQVLFDRYETFANEMLEDRAAGSAMTLRSSATRLVTSPSLRQVTQAGALEPPRVLISPAEFEWTQDLFPGSDNADNQTLFGKYDQGWAAAADTLRMPIWPWPTRRSLSLRRTTPSRTR